ncbi:carbohydrate kinase [candidate division KSB1 bacterium]
MKNILKKQRPIIFGEVLFDVLPDGVSILGGAPFNVAWHLKGLGLSPLMISRIGKDSYGDIIISSMKEWGMDTCGIQRDDNKPTGRVTVSFKNGQPSYKILADQAYDHIDETEALSCIERQNSFLLYHGSLSLRFYTTRTVFESLRTSLGVPGFYDLNLRKPWWNISIIKEHLRQNNWIKCNLDELKIISDRSIQTDIDLISAAIQVIDKYDMELLIVTRGEEGASVFNRENEGISVHSKINEKDIVDTVGAGDAFSSVYILGLIEDWPHTDILERAVDFASRICKIKGATIADHELYRFYRDSWSTENGS